MGCLDLHPLRTLRFALRFTARPFAPPYDRVMFVWSTVRSLKAPSLIRMFCAESSLPANSGHARERR